MRIVPICRIRSLRLDIEWRDLMNSAGLGNVGSEFFQPRSGCMFVVTLRAGSHPVRGEFANSQMELAADFEMSR